MTIFDIPNRPVGTQKRNVNDLISNFDTILDTLDAGVTEDNIVADAITAEKIQGSLRAKLGINNSQGTHRVSSSVVTGDETRSSTTFGDLATLGPDLTFSTLGPALVIGTLNYGDGGTFPACWGFAFISGPSTPYGSQVLSRSTSTHVLAIVTQAGTYTVRSRYASFDGTLAHFEDRRFHVVAYTI